MLPLLALLSAACSSSRAAPDDPFSNSVREFRETHIECTPHFYRIPCQIGPDGKLYQYNPGETDPPKKR